MMHKFSLLNINNEQKYKISFKNTIHLNSIFILIQVYVNNKINKIQIKTVKYIKSNVNPLLKVIKFKQIFT